MTPTTLDFVGRLAEYVDHVLRWPELSLRQESPQVLRMPTIPARIRQDQAIFQTK
jgi:hypothetical protein